MPRPPVISEESFDEISACASVTTLIEVLRGLVRQAPGVAMRRARVTAWMQIRTIAAGRCKEALLKPEPNTKDEAEADVAPTLPME